MSSVVFFKDISKRKGDLLTKDFASNENKVKLLGKSGDVSFESTILNKGDSTVGTFVPKYEYKPWKATFSGSVNTKKDFKGELALKDIAPGLKLTLTDDVTDKGFLGTAAIEYTRDQAAITGSVDIGGDEGSNLKGSVNLKVWKNLNVGGNIHYLQGKSSDIKEIKATVAWNTDEFDVSLSGNVKKTKAGDETEVGLGYFHKVNSTICVGTEIALDPNNSNPKKDTTMTFGAQYKIDDNATVKGKVDVTGKFGLSFTQKFTSNISFNLAANIDTLHFSNKNTSQFGFALNLE